MDRDWTGLEALLHADFRLLGRRRFVQLELDRAETLNFTRSIGDMHSTHFHPPEVLATRGEHLALARDSMELSDGEVGLSRFNYLNLIETRTSGIATSIVRFDVEDLDAAFLEIDIRFGEVCTLNNADSPAGENR